MDKRQTFNLYALSGDLTLLRQTIENNSLADLVRYSDTSKQGTVIDDYCKENNKLVAKVTITLDYLNPEIKLNVEELEEQKTKIQEQAMKQIDEINQKIQEIENAKQ